MRQDERLHVYQNTVAIITGGASGIGQALSRALSQSGARVVLADRQIELARQVATELNAKGGEAEARELDVTDFAATRRVVEETAETYGRLDYLFNNAGIAVGGEVSRYQVQDWYQVLDVNLRGVIHGVQAAYPLMIQQGSGHIINTASMSGLLLHPGGISYTTSKYAVVGLSQSLRIEAELYGVRVSVLCPGAIRTPILEGGGRFGRVLHQINPEMLREHWEKVRPMDPDLFATKVLCALARNEALIIYPRWWRLLWWLNRLSPAALARISRNQYAALRRKLEEISQAGGDS